MKEDEPTFNTPLVQLLTLFVNGERALYGTEDSNRAAFSIGQVTRYVGMAEVARQRCEHFQDLYAVHVQFMTGGLFKGSSKLSEEQRAELERGARTGQQLHMEIETYFLFTCILLDRIANCIYDFFGQEQGVRLQSHRNLKKNLERYADAKGLALPDDMIRYAKELFEEVVVYRDKNITHLKRPRAMHATLTHPEHGSRIAITALYPVDNDAQVESPIVKVVQAKVRTYVEMFIEVIQNNRGKSRYTVVKSSV